MRIQDIDLRQLRIFIAVVESNGISAAEGLLGLSQSTISESVAELEKRLGYQLCRRGRSGFLLTERGGELYASTVRLFRSIVDFQDEAQALKGACAGRLRLGLIDNLVSDPGCPIVKALAALHKGNARSPRITIDILSPTDIEDSLCADRIDVGISITDRRLSSLTYEILYQEKDVLVCSRTHPLFEGPPEPDVQQKIESAPKVVRPFLNKKDFVVTDFDETISGLVTNIEAAAYLILAGTHIGYLPDHYADKWVQTGQMRVLMPDLFRRSSDIVLIHRPDVSSALPIAGSFIGAVRGVIAANTSAKPMPASNLPHFPD